MLQGGTASAPAHLNDRNRAAPQDVWPDSSRCDFVVHLQPLGAKPDYGTRHLCPTTDDVRAVPFAEVLGENVVCRPADPDVWQRLVSMPFVEAALSPPLTRALYIPVLSEQRNVVSSYQLLQRRQPHL